MADHEDYKVIADECHGSVILPNGKYIGIGAALERLEFYTAGYAAFMGCKVGIGTTTPSESLTIGNAGKLQVNSAGDDKNIKLYHDDLAAHLMNSSGEFKFYTPALFSLHSGSGEFTFRGEENNTIFNCYSSLPRAQVNWCLKPTFGRQLVLADFDNRNRDHDHDVQDNPTLFIHSVTNPNTVNTQWLSFAHNQTNAIFGCGLGDYQFPDGNIDIINDGLKLGGALVTFGADDSGGAGFKVLIVPN